jgi:hypothetical protein
MPSWKSSKGLRAVMAGDSGMPVTCRTRPCMRPRRSSHIIDRLGVGVSRGSEAVHHIVKSVVERMGVSQPGISGMCGRSQPQPTPCSAIHRRQHADRGLWIRPSDPVSEGRHVTYAHVFPRRGERRRSVVGVGAVGDAYDSDRMHMPTALGRDPVPVTRPSDRDGAHRRRTGGQHRGFRSWRGTASPCPPDRRPLRRPGR